MINVINNRGPDLDCGYWDEACKEISGTYVSKDLFEYIKSCSSHLNDGLDHSYEIKQDNKKEKNQQVSGTYVSKEPCSHFDRALTDRTCMEIPCMILTGRSQVGV